MILIFICIISLVLSITSIIFLDSSTLKTKGEAYNGEIIDGRFYVSSEDQSLLEVTPFQWISQVVLFVTFIVSLITLLITMGILVIRYGLLEFFLNK